MIKKYLFPAKMAFWSTIDVFRRRPVSALVSTAAAISAAGLVFLIGAVVVAWLGIYDIAATKGHNAVFAWFLHFTMRNSVKAHAPPASPPSLDDPMLIAKGQSYADLRCAPCHGAAGRSGDLVTRDMLPAPPNIRALKSGFSPDQVHWIIKHGVKMSAMPAWPTQKRDDEIWSLVAYLDHVGKNPAEFQTRPQDSAQRPGIGGAVSLNTCFACHGSDGNGRDGVFPKLAGLSANYIQLSLKDYRAGKRPSGFMQPFAANLSDVDIQNFAAYFDKLTRRSDPKGAEPDQTKIQQGARIAELAHNTRPLPACQSCHVVDKPKLLSAIPNLAGQPASYLSAQLKLFRSGTRASTPDAKIMSRIARTLSDTDIENVSVYFAALPAEPHEAGDEHADSKMRPGSGNGDHP